MFKYDNDYSDQNDESLRGHCKYEKSESGIVSEKRCDLRRQQNYWVG